MQILTAICGVYLMSIWDLSQNHGAYVRMVGGVAAHVLHVVGLHY